MRRDNALLAVLTPIIGCTALMLLCSLAEPALCWPMDTITSHEMLAVESDFVLCRHPAIVPQSTGHTYYVAASGSDNNPGTETQPFRTISRGVGSLEAGDTLYIREGTYHEEIQVLASGASGNPITISAYPGELPVIDAQNSMPGDYEGFLITLRGDHIILNGLEVKNVYGTAVLMQGSYNTVRNMRIHHCLNKGILVSGGGLCSNGVTNTNNVVEDNEIWMTSLIHEEIAYGGMWVGALTAARCPENTIIRGNTVHETWGLGIQAHEAYNTAIEDNIVWNNQMSHFYINNAPFTVVQRNMSYNTPDTIFRYEGKPGTSIAFSDEKPEPLSHHVTIVNNLTLGGDRGFYFFNQQAGSGLKSFNIAHNTFVDSYTMAITIREGDHENSNIQNNIFAGGGTLASVSDSSGLHFSHNLWSKAPPVAAASAYDVIGDPLLTRSGSHDPGALDPSWFQLLSGSPAVDTGITLYEVVGDFRGFYRPYGTGYDIGAYESPFSIRVTDLRIVDATFGTQEVIITLGWKAPANAVTYTVRKNDSLLTGMNWAHAVDVLVPFTASAAGSTEWLTTSIDYTGDTVYFALKSQNQIGIWSELSNNAFWPSFDIYLPVVLKYSHIQDLSSGVTKSNSQSNCTLGILLVSLLGGTIIIAERTKGLQYGKHTE